MPDDPKKKQSRPSAADVTKQQFDITTDFSDNRETAANPRAAQTNPLLDETAAPTSERPKLTSIDSRNTSRNSGLVGNRDSEVQRLDLSGDLGDIGRQLVEWQLVTEEEWHAALEKVGENASLTEVLDILRQTPSKWDVKYPVLTDFQCERIKEGRTDELIYEHYIVLHELGEGGMGVVYVGRNTGLDNIVAIKTIRTQFFHEGTNATPAMTSLVRFKNEAKTLARLEPRYFPSVYHIGQVGGFPYYAMELVQGKNLAQLVEECKKEERQIPFNYCLKIFIEVANAIGKAHAANIVHRDLSPKNIMITNEDVPKILDFGIAKHVKHRSDDQTFRNLGEVAETGQKIGAPLFMSPEQHSGDVDSVDFSTDVYSLAATMFFVLTQEYPFTGNTLAEIAEKAFSPERPHVSKYRPDVPARLDSLLTRALAVNPKDRHQTMAEFADDLSEVLRVIDTPPVNWTKRILLGAGLAALILATPTYLLFFSKSVQPATAAEIAQAEWSKKIKQATTWKQLFPLLDDGKKNHYAVLPRDYLRGVESAVDQFAVQSMKPTGDQSPKFFLDKSMQFLKNYGEVTKTPAEIDIGNPVRALMKAHKREELVTLASMFAPYGKISGGIIEVLTSSAFDSKNRPSNEDSTEWLDIASAAAAGAEKQGYKSGLVTKVRAQQYELLHKIGAGLARTNPSEAADKLRLAVDQFKDVISPTIRMNVEQEIAVANFLKAPPSTLQQVVTFLSVLNSIENADDVAKRLALSEDQFPGKIVQQISKSRAAEISQSADRAESIQWVNDLKAKNCSPEIRKLAAKEYLARAEQSILRKDYDNARQMLSGVADTSPDPVDRDFNYQICLKASDYYSQTADKRSAIAEELIKRSGDEQNLDNQLQLVLATLFLNEGDQTLSANPTTSAKFYGAGDELLAKRSVGSADETRLRLDLLFGAAEAADSLSSRESDSLAKAASVLQARQLEGIAQNFEIKQRTNKTISYVLNRAATLLRGTDDGKNEKSLDAAQALLSSSENFRLIFDTDEIHFSQRELKSRIQFLQGETQFKAGKFAAAEESLGATREEQKYFYLAILPVLMKGQPPEQQPAFEKKTEIPASLRSQPLDSLLSASLKHLNVYRHDARDMRQYEEVARLYSESAKSFASPIFQWDQSLTASAKGNIIQVARQCYKDYSGELIKHLNEELKKKGYIAFEIRQAVDSSKAAGGKVPEIVGKKLDAIKEKLDETVKEADRFDSFEIYEEGADGKIGWGLKAQCRTLTARLLYYVAKGEAAGQDKFLGNLSKPELERLTAWCGKIYDSLREFDADSSKSNFHLTRKLPDQLDPAIDPGKGAVLYTILWTDAETKYGLERWMDVAHVCRYFREAEAVEAFAAIPADKSRAIKPAMAARTIDAYLIAALMKMIDDKESLGKLEDYLNSEKCHLWGGRPLSEFVYYNPSEADPKVKQRGDALKKADADRLRASRDRDIALLQAVSFIGSDNPSDAQKAQATKFFDERSKEFATETELGDCWTFFLCEAIALKLNDETRFRKLKLPTKGWYGIGITEKEYEESRKKYSTEPRRKLGWLRPDEQAKTE
jgi:serine/threonine protein kinase